MEEVEKEKKKGIIGKKRSAGKDVEERVGKESKMVLLEKEGKSWDGKRVEEVEKDVKRSC